MRPVVAGFVLASLSSLAAASETSAQDRLSPYVYLMKVSGCAGERGVRLLTGFRVAEPERNGIITALHGVVGCKTINAHNDRGEVFDGLTLLRVDVEADVALVSSPTLSKAAREGLAAAARIVDWSAMTRLRVFGHPLEAAHPLETVHHGDFLTLRVPPLRPLQDEVPPAVWQQLQARGSPSAKLQVLSVHGPLMPGHSGAPVLNQRNEVVAIANGGLQSGSVALGWAIPYRDVRLTPATGNERLAQLATHRASSLFKFEQSKEVEGTPARAATRVRGVIRDGVRFVRKFCEWRSSGVVDCHFSAQAVDRLAIPVVVALSPESSGAVIPGMAVEATASTGENSVSVTPTLVSLGGTPPKTWTGATVSKSVAMDGFVRFHDLDPATKAIVVFRIAVSVDGGRFSKIHFKDWSIAEPKPPEP